MTTVSISQPRYLPWPGYFHRMIRSDIHIVLDCVQFCRQAWENRNWVSTPTGPVWLTVPVTSPHGSAIANAAIDNRQLWQRKHWATLEQSYRKAPYFEDYADLQQFYLEPYTNLCQFNLAMLAWFTAKMQISTPLAIASELGIIGSGSQFLLELCQAVGATTYLAGPASHDYLEADLFKQAGIQVVYDTYQVPDYPRIHQWQPGTPLAAIDMLFNCGSEHI